MERHDEATAWIRALCTQAAQANAEPHDARVALLACIRAAGNALHALVDPKCAGEPDICDRGRIGDWLEARADDSFSAITASKQAQAVLP